MAGTESNRQRGKNPFVGPRPLEIGEKIYGRDREINELIWMLDAERIVLLYSPSGAGKSSLVQAGLIPKLRDRYDVWRPTRLNQEPPTDLDSGSRINRYVYSAIQGFEEGIPNELRRPIAQLARQTLPEFLAKRPQQPGSPRSILLIFDQFEEILTIDPLDRKAKWEFFDQMGAMLRDPKVWALFVLREDYLAPLDPYASQVPTQLQNRYRIDLLGLAAAREAIDKISQHGGGEIPRSHELVEDLACVRAQLADGSFKTKNGDYVEPVQLQVVCHDFWSMRDSRCRFVRKTQSISSGNVDQALGRYYSNSVQSASTGNDQNRAIRLWFGEKLITSGSTRGHVLRSVGESGGLSNELIERLIGCHLVRVEKRSGTCWFELSHDRLIEPILEDNKIWFEEHLHSTQRQASLWMKQGQPDSLLLRGDQLRDAERWAESANLMEGSPERKLISHSQSLRESVLREARQARRLRIGFALALIFSILSIVLASLALDAKQEAQREARNARNAQRQAKMETQNANYNLARVLRERSKTTGLDARAAFLFVADALEQDVDPERHPLDWQLLEPIVGRDILSSAFANRWFLDSSLQTGGRFTTVSLSPDSVTIASGQRNGTVQLWNLETGSEVSAPLILDNDWIRSIVFSGDGTLVAAGSDRGYIRIWDSQSGVSIGDRISAHPGWIRCLAFSSDGRTLVSGSNDGTLRQWDVSTGQALGGPLLGHSGPVLSVSFLSKGQFLVTASSDGTVRTWDASLGKQLTKKNLESGLSITSATFSPDGRKLAFGTASGAARVIDVTSWQPLSQLLQGSLAPIRSVAIGLSGQLVATGSTDGLIHVWDLSASRRPLLKLFGHVDSIDSVVFSQDEYTLVSSSADGTVRHWDVSSASERKLLLHKQDKSACCVEFSSSGKTLGFGSSDGTISLWDIQSGRIGGASPPAISRPIEGIAFSLDGSRIVSMSSIGVMQLWHTQSLKNISALQVIPRNAKKIADIVYCRSSDRLIMSAGNMVFMHDSPFAINSFSKPLFGKDSQAEVTAAKLSSPVSTVGLPGSKTDLKNWKHLIGVRDSVIALPVIAASSDVLSIAVSPDGETLASGSDDGAVRFWDVLTGREKGAPISLHKGRVLGIAFNSDGRLLASSSSDGTIRLLDVVSREAIGQPLTGDSAGVTDVTFSPDGRSLVSASEDGAIRTWDVRPYGLFLDRGRPTPLFRRFLEGARFFWQIKRRDLRYVHSIRSTVLPIDGYHFEYEPRFRPLLDPPRPNQSKFDQILEWAQEELSQDR